MKLKSLSEVQSNSKKNSEILEINANIRQILKEISNIQSKEISEKAKDVLVRADMIILECHATKEFDTNKNGTFNRLLYEYQKLSLKYETFNVEKEIAKVNKTLKDVETKQEEYEKQSNNLVYTILSFIASFSIISASVTAISGIEGALNQMLFIVFIAFILVTTLIALDNFYKNRRKTDNKLQDNYFLWKLLGVVMIVLFIICGINAYEGKPSNQTDIQIYNE